MRILRWIVVERIVVVVIVGGADAVVVIVIIVYCPIPFRMNGIPLVANHQPKHNFVSCLYPLIYSFSFQADVRLYSS